jgi:hypothetical protein
MDLTLGLRIKDYPRLLPKVYGFSTNIAKDAMIGAEFEIEGNNLPRQFNYYWQATDDGSLRGPHAEFVLTRPITVERFKERAFPYLTKQCKKNKAKFNISGRCSTHIHINVQNMYAYQVFAFAGLYYLFEPAALFLAGEERSGNLFCVGANNSAYIPMMMTNAVMNVDKHCIHNVFGSEYKYSAVNFCSVRKYGSLEFRAMRGTLDPDDVYPWIDFLVALRNYAANMTPQDMPMLLQNLSQQGPTEFLGEIIGKDTPYRKIVAMAGSKEDLDNLIYESIGYNQAVFFEPEWDKLLLHDFSTDEKYVEAVKKGIKDDTISKTDSNYLLSYTSPQLYKTIMGDKAKPTTINYEQLARLERMPFERGQRGNRPAAVRRRPRGLRPGQVVRQEGGRVILEIE